MPMPITRMFLVAVLLCGGLAPASRSSAQEAGGSSCGMEAGTFTTGSANHPRIKLLKSSSDAKTIFVVANKMAVNTDGSPRSYHLLDPKGQKYALNDICNAVVTAFEGGSEISCFRSSSRPRYYDILAQVVREHDGFGFVDQGYNPQQDAAYSLGGDFGLDLDEPEVPLAARAPTYKFPIEATPRAAGKRKFCYDCKSGGCKVCFDQDIIKVGGNKACFRDKGKYAGYLSNLTSIDPIASNKPDPENVDGANLDDDACRHEIKIDAEKLPGLVLPRGALGADGDAAKARIGDIAVLYNLHTGRWAFAVVNDAGPVADFGEGSIALNRILRSGYKSPTPRPVTYKDAKALHIANRVALLLFPGTKERFKGDYAPASVAKAAKEAFEKWGGGDLVKARKRFRNCLGVLPESYSGQF
jgi:hypothetical protein